MSRDLRFQQRDVAEAPRGVILVHPRELVIAIHVPLRQSLGLLCDGHYARFSSVTHAEYAANEEALRSHYLLRLADNNILGWASAMPPEFLGDDGRERWDLLAVVRSEVGFYAVEMDAAGAPSYEQMARAAQDRPPFAPAGTASEPPHHATGDDDGDVPLHLATVAEITVPTRVLVPEGFELDHISYRPPFVPRLPLEFVEATADLEISGRVNQGVEIGLSHLRDILGGVYAATGIPTEAPTLETIGPVVPVVASRYGADGQVPTQIVPFMALQAIQRDVEGRKAQPAHSRALRSIDVVSRGPIGPYMEVRRALDQTDDLDGNAHMTAILGGLAGEVLLATTFGLMAWGAGRTPEFAGADWSVEVPLRRRVGTALHPLLRGGTWSTEPDKPSAFGEWYRSAWSLRHRAVHGNYWPSREEIHASRTALGGLEREVARLLCRPKNLSTSSFARTAFQHANLLRSDPEFSVVPGSALDQQILSVGRVYARWREVMSRYASVGGRSFDLHLNELLLVPGAEPAGDRTWFLYSAECGIAGELHEASPGQARSWSRSQLAHELRDALDADLGSSSAPDRRQGPAIQAGVTSDLARSVKWFAAYHFIPGEEAMCDGSDRLPIHLDMVAPVRVAITE